MIETPHPLDGQFEPAAEAVSKNDPRIPLLDIAQASAAISLKRIADELAGTTSRFGLIDTMHYIGARP